MKLLEILHTIKDERQKNLVNVDDWKWADADHLKTMGFDFDGDYGMVLKDPHIRIYQKENPEGSFVVEDKTKGTRVFQSFDQVVEYFDHYSQPEIDKQKS